MTFHFVRSFASVTGLFALLLASACGSSVQGDHTDDGCTWEGKTYPIGATFKDADGCNSCECQEDGTVGCTLMACGDDCTYGGEVHPFGSAFPSLDGCNTCTCDANGVNCTEMACACDPASEWWREYAAEDPKTCQVIDYACPENTTMFGNDCGCGCEQDPSCPQAFDCQPPKSCDAEALHAQCPYSDIAL